MFVWIFPVMIQYCPTCAKQVERGEHDDWCPEEGVCPTCLELLQLGQAYPFYGEYLCKGCYFPKVKKANKKK